MTGGTPQTAGGDWLDEGRRAAGALDAVSSAVVVGRDPEATAWAALGLARTQAERRRVAVADLIGEVPPLQALVDADPDADPHGISDSFLYGVSLNKIAHPADATGSLWVLPSGSEAVATEEVFRSDRWRRLASGFREVGALLLLVARSDTPGLDTLAASVDGTVLVGDAAGVLPDAAPPLVVIAPARRRAAVAGLPTGATPGATDPTRARPWVRWAVVAMLAIVLAGGLSFWLYPRTIGRTGAVPAHRDSVRRGPGSRADSVRRDSAHRTDSAAAAAPRDSTRAAAASAPAPAPPPLPSLTVANPADSSSAMAWSVDLGTFNTMEGASTALDPRTAATLPSIALTPLLADGAPWYRVLLGAFATSAQADSMWRALQRRGLLGPGSGQVVRTPYALLVADHVPAQDVPARVQALAKKNVPVYALSRGDGTAALYAGAFERPEQAAWLARALQTAGVTSSLVYRTGRSL